MVKLLIMSNLTFAIVFSKVVCCRGVRKRLYMGKGYTNPRTFTNALELRYRLWSRGKVSASGVVSIPGRDIAKTLKVIVKALLLWRSCNVG